MSTRLRCGGKAPQPAHQTNPREVCLALAVVPREPRSRERCIARMRRKREVALAVRSVVATLVPLDRVSRPCPRKLKSRPH